MELEVKIKNNKEKVIGPKALSAAHLFFICTMIFSCYFEFVDSLTHLILFSAPLPFIFLKIFKMMAKYTTFLFKIQLKGPITLHFTQIMGPTGPFLFKILADWPLHLHFKQKTVLMKGKLSYKRASGPL